MDSPKKQASKILRDKKMYQRWLAIFMCLALVVTSGTVTALKLTGQAMTAKQLQCSYVLHEHTEECYNDEGELVCGLSDKVVHTHDSSCYDAEDALVCPLEELEPHEHDESCYTEVKTLVCGEEEHEAIPAHHHTEECYTTETAEEQVLTCGLEETDGVPAVEAAPGHVHTDACYTTETVEVTPATYDEEGNELTAAVTEEQRTLTCGMAEGEGAVEGQPEIPAHHHTEECYTTQTTETQVLTCGLEEHDEEIPAHHHTDECYTTSTELTCGKDEVILHVHTDDCYEIVVDEETGEEISRTLTCTQPQLEAHQHGDECFVEVAVDEIVPSEQPEEELPTASVVYCGKDAHTHTDECYQQDENGEFVLDENGEKILVCELEEHEHTEECYIQPDQPDERELICGKQEHTHTDECYQQDENGEFVLDENGEKILICGLEEHTHTEECYAPAEAELLTATKTVGDVTVTVEYSEDANFPEGTELDFYEYAKDSAEYAQYAEQVEGEMDRLFNIGFYLNGEEVEPAEGAIVKVNITYPGMEEKRQQVTHFTDEGPVALGTETITEGENTTVEFYTDSFSPIAVSTLADDDKIIVLKVGGQATLSVSGKGIDDGDRWVSWTSSDNAVSVSPQSNGSRYATITAKAVPQNQPVTIHAEWGFLGVYNEYFEVYVLAIKGHDTVEVGNSIPLELVGVPEGVWDVQWTFSGRGGVDFSDTSRTGATITGKTEGTVTVTASFTLNGKSYNVQHSVTVTPSTSGGPGTVTPGHINADKYISTNYGDGTYDLNLTFNASKGSASTTPKVDVIFVVDTSGSMDGTRMKTVNDAVTGAVQYLYRNREKIDAQYAVVRFASSASVAQRLTEVKPNNIETGLPSNGKGGTNYEAGLKAANSVSTRSDAEKVVIFLSDGKPTYRDTPLGDYCIVGGGHYHDASRRPPYGNGKNDDCGRNIKAAQDYLKSKLAPNTNHFYAVAVPNDLTVMDKLDQLLSVLDGKVKTDKAFGASDKESLNGIFEKILGRVIDVYCSKVTATDNLQPYVTLAGDVGGDASALTVSIVDKNGNPVSSINGNGSSNQLTINYQDADKNNQTAIFKAEYDPDNKKIIGRFEPDTYTLNPDWTYKITARIKVDEDAKEYVPGDTETDEGINKTLKYGVYTNKGMSMDYVFGNFQGTEQTANFPRPVVPLPRTLNITKVDAEDDTKGLTGAVFTLYRNNKEVKTFTIESTEGKLDITGIAAGKYILKETKAPTNYKLPAEDDYLEITVQDDGSVAFEPNLENSKVWPNDLTAMGSTTASTAFMVKNEQSGVPVEIVKKGVEGVTLKGVSFKIGDSDEQYVVEEANATEAVIFDDNLPIGTTVITETLPTGSQYQKIDPVRVKIEKDENATDTGGYKLTFVNDKDAEIKDYTVASAKYDTENEKWVVTIQNTLAPISGVEIFKTTYGATGDKAGLSGAQFDLYVATNNEDYSAGLPKIATGLTTGDNGKIAITADGFAGFEEGKTYYLVETKAPAGYVAGSEPIKITVKVENGVAKIYATAKANNSGDAVKVDEKTITVYNSAGVELPHTGGIGTQLFTVGGGLLMVLAAGLYFWNKRRISEM